MRSALVIVATFTVASLMTGPTLGDNCANACGPAGLQFTPPTTSDPDVYDISLPCCNPYFDLSDVYDDISAGGCAPAAVTRIFPDQSTCSWTGPLSCDVCLDCGMAVRVSTFGPCPGWPVLGANCVGPLVDVCGAASGRTAGTVRIPSHY